MATYELTTGTREDFNNVQCQLINDFIQQIIGAEVTTDWRNPHAGRVVPCLNPSNNFESVIASVYFDDTDETKSYGIVAAMNCGGLLFVDESMVALYDEFKKANENIKHQWFEATQEAQRRQKEEQKLEQKRKANEKKLEGLKVSAEKEFNNLLNDSGKKITETDEFYWTLGWLTSHVGTLSAKMPDFLEASFVKHFGDVEHTTVDSTKVGPAGYTSQWRLSMEASLVKAKEIPATLTKYLNPAGKKLSKTSFIWKLVDDFGFKFGKKQDALDIMRCVPIQYVPIFNEGMKA
jgi:hypothetical protein